MNKKVKKENVVQEAYLVTDDPSYIEVKKLADKHSLTMEQLFSEEKHDEEVVNVLFNCLPKLTKMFTPKKIFLQGYKLKREVFIQQYALLDKNNK